MPAPTTTTGSFSRTDMRKGRKSGMRSGIALGCLGGATGHPEALLQAPAGCRQRLIMGMEQVALKEKPGQRQALGDRCGTALAAPDAEGRQRQPLLTIERKSVV